MPAARLLERVPLPPHPARRRALRRRRQSDRPFALARDAQRRVCRARPERGVRAAAGRDVDDFVDFRTRDWHARRQHHGAVQGRDADAGGRDRSPGAARRRRQHARSSATAAGSARTRMSKGFWRRWPAGSRSRARARRCSERRRRTRGRGRRSVARARRSTICARQAEAAAEVARPCRMPRPAPGRPARQLGRARQRHVVRAAAGPATTRWPACRSTARSCSTSSTRPPDTPLIKRAAREGCLTIGGIEMLVAQAERQFELWTGHGPPAGLFEAAAAARDRRRAARAARQGTAAVKQTTFEEFVELARRGTFVPVVKEIIADLLTPVSAFLKIAEHSDYAFLFESVEGGEQRRALLVSRQGSVPRPAAARRQDRHRSIGRHDRKRRAVRRRAAPADGGVPVAVRPGSAAVHRRRRRVHRLRRVAGVRAGTARGLGQRTVEHGRQHGGSLKPEDDAGFMLFDTVLAFDHVKHRILIIANARVTADEDLPRALPVRVREDPVPRARARARALAGRSRDAGGAGRSART